LLSLLARYFVPSFPISSTYGPLTRQDLLSNIEQFRKEFLSGTGGSTHDRELITAGKLRAGRM
jgi:hypothetical protein